MAEHVLAGNPGVYTELLGQIAKSSPEFVLLVQNVDRTEVNAPRVRFQERRQGAHQSRLAGAVRTEQAVHPVRDGQRDIVERLDAVWVGLGYVFNLQFHAGLLSPCACEDDKCALSDSFTRSWARP